MSDERHRDRIDDAVERILSSLDGLDEIDAGPYFVTRVQQRLADMESAPWWGRRIRPAYIALILLLNIVTVSLTLSGNRNAAGDHASEVSALAQQYSLGASGSMLMLGGGPER